MTRREAALARNLLVRTALNDLGHRQSPLVTDEDVSVIPHGNPVLRPWRSAGREKGDPTGAVARMLYEGGLAA